MPEATRLEHGLTSEQVRERVADGRGNDVPTRAGRTLGDIVRTNVLTRFNAVLGALFAVIVVVGPLKDGLFGLIILVNSLIGIVQELRAKRTLERLAIVGEAKPVVWRDGAPVPVGASEVVLDDVLELGTGDNVVVDGVVVGADALEVDESLLTGEADPVVKHPGDPVMSGSFAVAGTGRYRATRVGRDAYAAKLAEEASRFTLVSSELRAGIDRILRFVTWILLPAGALIIYSQLHGNEDLPSALRGAVAALVPMVPEGLVLLTSVAFAVGVVRLGQRNCLVQELPAIEGLARVDVVCADKTGTLTENGMRLTEVRPLFAGFAADEVLAAFAAADPRPNTSLQAVAEAYPSAPSWPVTAFAAFSSARKWSGASFGSFGDWVLGAADVLLPRASAALVAAEELGAQGLRVLLLARASVPVDSASAPGEVEPMALVVLAQRVRPDAGETLAYFADQGVTVKVISGDNAVAVGAVASSLGLAGAGAPVDARRLPSALGDEVEEGAVFGRVTPAQKRDMVAALQERGHTVAMTGDGVNDVLALKDADIGVAMGSGSPATRAVAQIVLLDDRFATLPFVVAEGRRVIGNVERVANLFLVKTVYSVLLAILIGVVGFPFPFQPLHLTLIGGLTIGIPAFFLALAPNGDRARDGFVRRVLRMAVPVGSVAAVATFAAYWISRAVDNGTTQAQDSTTAVITLFLIALWVLGVVARPLVWWKSTLVATMGCCFLLVLLIPFGRSFFELDPTDFSSVATALVVSFAAVAMIEVVRRIFR